MLTNLANAYVLVSYVVGSVTITTGICKAVDKIADKVTKTKKSDDKKDFIQTYELLRNEIGA